MHKLKIVSPIWSIRHKASLKNFFISLVMIDGEKYVLMKRKNRHLSVHSHYGEYFIRKSNPKTHKRLSNYLWLEKTKKNEFSDIKNYFIKISEMIYSGWHLVIKGDMLEEFSH